MVTKEFETSQGTVILRGLKRKEVKALRAAGQNVGNAIPVAELEDHTQAVLAVVLPEAFMQEKFEELMEMEILMMHREVINLTYPSPEQAKN